jgi:hypothetical protein
MDKDVHFFQPKREVIDMLYNEIDRYIKYLCEEFGDPATVSLSRNGGIESSLRYGDGTKIVLDSHQEKTRLFKAGNKEVHGRVVLMTIQIKVFMDYPPTWKCRVLTDNGHELDYSRGWEW